MREDRKTGFRKEGRGKCERHPIKQPRRRVH